jgi:WG containing repeat
VKKIEISRTSALNWYQPEELLRLLPDFTAVEGTYLIKQPFQRGAFILKKGKKITWLANGKDSILLYEGSNEQLFRLAKQTKVKATFPIWDKDGKDGFIDIEGNIVLDAEKYRREFSEGLAPFSSGGKWGYINEKGEVVIKPRWNDLKGFEFPAVAPFHEGLAAVIEETMRYGEEDLDYFAYKCGYINTKGKYVIAPKFRQSCGNFSDGLARISVDLKGDEYETGKGWIGFMNRQGKWAFERRFYEVGDFHDGFALVKSEPNLQSSNGEIVSSVYNFDPKFFYLIDTNGRKVENKKDCRWRYEFHEGLAMIDTENNQKAIINEQCEQVFQLSPDLRTDAYYFLYKGYSGDWAYSAHFSEGLLPVYKPIGKARFFGYLDRTGKTAIDFKFADATPFSDGLAGVEIVNKDKAPLTDNFYINRKGEIVLKNTRGIAPFYNGLAFHHLATWTISERPNQRNIYGYMNKRGKYVWLSPGAKIHLDKDWIKENYVGPKQTENL